MAEETKGNTKENNLRLLQVITNGLPMVSVEDPNEEDSAGTEHHQSSEGSDQKAPNTETGPEDAGPEESQRDCGSAQSARQVRVHSLFSQVRHQVRAQAGLGFQSQGMLNVVQRITRAELEKNKAMEEAASPETEETSAGFPDHSPGKDDETVEDELAALREEVMVNTEALRSRFKKEMDALRDELQAYCDNAVKRLEMDQKKGSVISKKQKSLSMPSLATGKKRVLSRTMTSLTPRTVNAASLGPRSKSETLESSTERSSDRLLLDTPHFQVLTSRTKPPKGPGRLPLVSPSPHGNGTAKKFGKNTLLTARMETPGTQYP
ncbi:UNVERIFIED_CONTAM: hypothetical protein FKN15_075731 [Acipenser sinensis]